MEAFHFEIPEHWAFNLKEMYQISFVIVLSTRSQSKSKEAKVDMNSA